MQRSCEPRGHEEFLIFDVGFWIGAEIARAKTAKPRRGAGRSGTQRNAGGAGTIHAIGLQQQGFESEIEND